MALTTTHELLDFLALSASEFGDLLDLVDKNKVKLAVLENLARDKAELAYHAAIQETLEQIAPIIRNNPGKTFAEIWARPDVQFELADNLAAARDVSEKSMRQAHAQGSRMGLHHARAEAKMLKLNLGQPSAGATDEYLNLVLADLENNATQSIGRLADAAEAGFGIPQLQTEGYPDLPNNVRADLARRRDLAVRRAMEREGADLGRRAGAGASVVANRTYSESQLAEHHAIAAANPGKELRKVWVTNFSPTTCGSCAALHGTVLSLDVQFDAAHTFSAAKPPKVYKDLVVPPRHPHCRCRIMLYVTDLTEPGDQISPATMRKYGRDWAEETPGMAPVSAQGTKPDIPDVGRDFIHSSSLAGMGDAEFEQMSLDFKACILSKIDKLL